MAAKKQTTRAAASRSTATDPAREKAKDADVARRAAEAERESARTPGRRRSAASTESPSWLAPLAVTLLIIGLIYLMVYYLSTGQLPVPIGNWNLLVGFGIMAIGGITLMFWK
ncbi:cell division protein CrgA [Brachybacterium sp. JHP9]|uniref:Cell division protein CrgA n=1 Tax=Brachybacterium equifaecis TaxID=2910770 RepID=A0ABT0QXW2_9MICO|nr:cell division protein CrgA [Brachybacterium equifaecis]MCL6422489.1 cell division protein CrgA [Brachybacterium equifaecis]